MEGVTKHAEEVRPSLLVIVDGPGRQAAVYEPQGRRAGLLDEVDLDGGAPGRYPLDDLEAARTDLEAAVRAWCDWKAGSAKQG